LLRFMAEKTSEMAGGDEASRASALEFKLDAIRDMRRIATSSGACVRSSVVEYFGEMPSTRQRSIALRIAEWVLSRSVRVRRTRFCCDQCDRVNVADAHDVIRWADEVFAQDR
jgi:hypothetical protein